MMVTVAELEPTLGIAFDILLYIYLEERGPVHNSVEIWNYLRSVGIDGNRTLVQVLKEQLHGKCFTEE